ncbi:MAG: glycosyltransferase family 4 protein [Desulfobaccales bacterium]
MTPDTPPQVIVAQIGARMHYAVPLLLQRAGMLAHFYTDAYSGPGSWLHYPLRVASMLPKKLWGNPLTSLISRCDSEIPVNKITAFNWLGFKYSIRLSRAKTLSEKQTIYINISKSFCEKIVKKGLNGADIVYTFESNGLELLTECQKEGLTGLVEQSVAAKKIASKLLAEEYEAWPDWELSYSEKYDWANRMAREEEEWGLADKIICPSEFVANGLKSLKVSPEKIVIVPYGIDTRKWSKIDRKPHKGPLRIIFVGELGVRKGLPYLLEAISRLPKGGVVTRLIGKSNIRLDKLRRFQKLVEITGLLPRSMIPEQYHWGDVFIFPSICEGSATVTYEAMAAGLPIITTPNAGSVVRDGIDGFIVPIRDAGAIAEKLEILLRDRELLVWMSQNARARAEEFSWNHYGTRLENMLMNL